jgi:hypothetical protein
MIDFVFLGGWVTGREGWKGGVLYSSVWNWSPYQDSPLLSRSNKLNKLLTKWSRILLEKLVLPHLLEKFSAFYGTRKFITVFAGSPLVPCVHVSSLPHINFPTHLILLPFITAIKFGAVYRSWISSLCHFLQYPVTSSFLNSLSL